MSEETHCGICHICGEYGKLSFEHIPPKNAFNAKRAKVYDGNEILKKYYQILKLY